jgi:hypothetical protein
MIGRTARRRQRLPCGGAAKPGVWFGGTFRPVGLEDSSEPLHASVATHLSRQRVGTSRELSIALSSVIARDINDARRRHARDDPLRRRALATAKRWISYPMSAIAPGTRIAALGEQRTRACALDSERSPFQTARNFVCQLVFPPFRRQFGCRDARYPGQDRSIRAVEPALDRSTWFARRPAGKAPGPKRVRKRCAEWPMRARLKNSRSQLSRLQPDTLRAFHGGMAVRRFFTQADVARASVTPIRLRLTRRVVHESSVIGANFRGCNPFSLSRSQAAWRPSTRAVRSDRSPVGDTGDHHARRSYAPTVE